MEMQVGGREPWFRVVERKISILDGHVVLEIEDPILSPIFENKDCDFLYSFSPPRPLFAPPRNALIPTHPDLSQYCNDVTDYTLLLNLIKPYQHSPCTTTYDLSHTSRELKDLQNSTLRDSCLQPAPPDPPPMVVWKLSMNDDTNGSFTMLSVGFSRRHLLHRSCFTCEIRGCNCSSVPAGTPTCDAAEIVPEKKDAAEKKHEGAKWLIIGFSTGAGLFILATLSLWLWCGNKNEKAPSTSTTSLFRTAPSDPSGEDLEAAGDNYPTHVFSYEELHEATNGFSPSNELDQGGHSAVYRGTLTDGRPVAVKRPYKNGCRRIEQFNNEIAILSLLRHPNLVALYGCTSRQSRELLLVYEFIPNGTIADHLHGHRAAEGALNWTLRLRIAVETATALAYLHAVEPQIIHRDVKTKNILLDGDFHVKVADFGLSKLFPVAVSHVSTVPQGTPGYVDPEYHRCYQLTDKSDVYSFGVVLAELISSKPAVDVTRHRHEINLSNMARSKIMNAALRELVDPKLGFETDWEVRRSIELVADLAMMCLQDERETRPTMEVALEVLRGIKDGLLQALKGRVVDHMVGDDMALLQNCATASPNSVIGKWSSTKTTPSATG